jgi:hypothetical protein
MLNLYKYGNNHPITMQLSQYAENGNPYVGLITNEEGYNEPWSDLTVNLSILCEKNCAFIDTNNNGEEIIDWLISNNLGKLTGRIEPSGWCVYPEFEFNMEELAKYVVYDDREESK